AHQVEEDFVFALKMMIEPAFAELERGGYVIHRSGVVSLLLKQARGGAQDFLARIGDGFTGHRMKIIYTQRDEDPSQPAWNLSRPRRPRHVVSGTIGESLNGAGRLVASAAYHAGAAHDEQIGHVVCLMILVHNRDLGVVSHPAGSEQVYA